MIREQILEMAKKTICRDRNDQYGEPEDNFKKIAQYWGLYLGKKIDAYDVAIMMTLFKVARMMTGKEKEDNFVDAIGYLACGAEIKFKGKNINLENTDVIEDNVEKSSLVKTLDK